MIVENGVSVAHKRVVGWARVVANQLLLSVGDELIIVAFAQRLLAEEQLVASAYERHRTRLLLHQPYFRLSFPFRQ